MTLWMKVTKDDYELPLIVCSTLTELANRCGVSKGDISQAISKYTAGKIRHTAYRRVEVFEELEPGDEEELEYLAKQDAKPAYRSKAKPKPTVSELEVVTERIVKDERNVIVNCDECEFCLAVIRIDGKDDTRLCCLSRRLIDDRVRVSPTWCPGRRE